MIEEELQPQLEEEDNFDPNEMLRSMFDEDDLFDLDNDGGDPLGLND